MFKNPFSFNGRIRRTEFGITVIIFAFANGIISSFMKPSSEADFLGLAYIPLLWFLFAQGAKREHDLDFSGWWQLIPFRYLWLIFLKGQVGLNKYGPEPKEKTLN